MKLLVVEDDAETRSYLERGLRESGHTVVSAVDGRDALFVASVETYDAIVLDRMLPHTDGLAVLRSLRASGNMTPILLLTAIVGVEDRVEGLEAGADDYLTKPFAFSELMARLSALGRRPTRPGGENILRAGKVEINLLKREVRCCGRCIEVQPREFALLEELVRASGRIVTRTMLLERVWNLHFDPRTNIVETHISRLRRKLSVNRNDDVILTIRGSGYTIAADA